VPTYQYVCTSCQTPLEVVQGFHDDALTRCPSCEQETLRKVFSSVGVVFKGSGFYRNDSRSSTSSSTPAASGSSSTSTDGGSAGSSSTSTSSDSGSSSSPAPAAAPAPAATSTPSTGVASS